MPEPHIKLVSLLDLDPDFAERLPEGVCGTVRRRALVQLGTFESGPWEGWLASCVSQRGLGVLVVDGLLACEVQVAGQVSAELFGAGDVILAGKTDDLGLYSTGRWNAVVSGRAAWLDEQLSARIAPWPSLAGVIASRSTRRGRVLAALALTRRMRRVDDRLVFIFALFAERWGRVTSQGICLPLPVTHELLGRVIGARRQSVTTALGDLRSRGVITPLPEGEWLLAGPPAPAALVLARARATRPSGTQATP